MRELQILTAQPNDLYFNWQLRVQLHNLRKYGLSDKYTALVWKHSERAGKETFEEEWKKLQKDYPEAKIVFYEDPSGELHRLIRVMNYIPLLRPWLLNKYFSEHAHFLDGKAILYMDSDVVFTKKPNFDRLLNDDICYLSDTKSYISAEYFDSKIKDVLPEKLEPFKNIDVLDELTKEFGINRQIAEAYNEDGSGGAQYLLKNINAQFWQDVFQGCIKVLMNLRHVNRMFFENENKGFQSWCADMWSILFNLWSKEYVTKCPQEMDFAWATDKIEKWDQVQIYHDAGATSRNHDNAVLFHKRELKYINNQSTPFEDDLSDVSKDYCSSKYVEEIWAANPSKYESIYFEQMTELPK